MSRQWNHQILSPTYSNLVLGLGGVSSATQLTDARYASHIKPADYLGVRYDKHFPLTTTDPSAGFYMDGLPGIIDPRAYKTLHHRWRHGEPPTSASIPRGARPLRRPSTS